MRERIDLGYDHFLEFTSWSPDRELNPQFADTPDVEYYGAIVEHPARNGNGNNGNGTCASGVNFHGPVQDKQQNEDALWTVESLDPLTLSPSLLCRVCGDHGFIRDGRWVPA